MKLNPAGCEMKRGPEEKQRDATALVPPAWASALEGLGKQARGTTGEAFSSLQQAALPQFTHSAGSTVLPPSPLCCCSPSPHTGCLPREIRLQESRTLTAGRSRNRRALSCQIRPGPVIHKQRKKEKATIPFLFPPMF